VSTRMVRWSMVALVASVGVLNRATPQAQSPAPPPAPWRGAGSTPCTGSDGGVYQCAPESPTTAIKAGRLFDSHAGAMLSRQVVIVKGDRIIDVGPEARVRIPAGARLIDLGRMTVLPGLIDAHTHMFNTRGPKTTTETAMLIAVQNVAADLRAGFTTARDMSSHGNGYADVEVRNAINEGRIDGPRFQVSTLGIVWGAAPATTPANPLTSTVVRSADEARAAVREQIERGADWIKLFRPATMRSHRPARCNTR
jgi:imidazolonepropionase-like amidohydrolase